MTIIWQPLPQPSTEKSASSNVNSSISKARKADKKPDAPPALGQTGSTTRTVWLRFHPSIQLEVFDTLKQAASRTLIKYKTNSDGLQEATLEIADLRRHFNAFEIMGPKSSQVIKGVLSPVASENRKEFLEVSVQYNDMNAVAIMRCSFGRR